MVLQQPSACASVAARGIHGLLEQGRVRREAPQVLHPELGHRRRAAGCSPPTWGKTRCPRCVHRGESAGSGSSTKTSSTAPAIRLAAHRLHQIGIHHEIAPARSSGARPSASSAPASGVDDAAGLGVEGRGGARSPTGPALRRGPPVRRPARPRHAAPARAGCRSPASRGRSPCAPPRPRSCRPRGRRASCRRACRSSGASSAARAGRARCRPSCFCTKNSAARMCSGIDSRWIPARRSGRRRAGRSGEASHCSHASGEAVDPAQARRPRARAGTAAARPSIASARPRTSSPGSAPAGSGPIRRCVRSRRPSRRAD